MFWEGNFFTENVGKRRVTVLAFERRRTVQHFVDQNAQSPPVDSTGMPTALYNFRSDVLFGADK